MKQCDICKSNVLLGQLAKFCVTIFACHAVAFNDCKCYKCAYFCISVLKLLKMAKGIRALLDTVMQALPQVGNLGLLFFLLFFIFAALGVEMFGRLGNTTRFMCCI